MDDGNQSCEYRTFIRKNYGELSNSSSQSSTLRDTLITSLQNRLVNPQKQLPLHFKNSFVSDSANEYSKRSSSQDVEQEAQLNYNPMHIPRNACMKSRLTRLHLRLQEQQRKIGELLVENLTPSGVQRLEAELVRHGELADQLLAIEQGRNMLVGRVFAIPPKNKCDHTTNTEQVGDTSSIAELLWRIESEIGALFNLVVDQRHVFRDQLRASWSENDRLRKEMVAGDPQSVSSMRAKCEDIERQISEVRLNEHYRNQEVTQLVADLQKSESRALDLEAQVSELRGLLHLTSNAPDLLDQLVLLQQQQVRSLLTIAGGYLPSSEDSPRSGENAAGSAPLDERPNSASLRIESLNAEGKCETLRAVLNSPIGLASSVEVESGRALNLRLEYSPAGDQSSRSSNHKIGGLRGMCSQLFGGGTDSAKPRQ